MARSSKGSPLWMNRPSPANRPLSYGRKRRPERGHGRHPHPLRPHKGADNRQPGRDLPRPYDLHGRERHPAENPERDCPGNPARPAFLPFIVVVARLLPFAAYSGVAFPSPCSSRSSSVSYPRRSGESCPYRHRRHGPPDPAQCDRSDGQAVESSGDVDVVLLDKTGNHGQPDRPPISYLPKGWPPRS